MSWSCGATRPAPVEAQMRERRHSFARRIEAVNRIQDAASGLMERIAEIEDAERNLAGAGAAPARAHRAAGAASACR